MSEKKLKIASSNPIRSEFRDVGTYAKIAADVFLATGKYTMRPHDWAVMGRVFSHLGVRGLQKGFALPESVDQLLKVAAELGDTTYKYGTYMAARAGVPTTHEVPATNFEKQLEKIAKEPEKGN